MQLSHILIIKAASELNDKSTHPTDILKKYRKYGPAPPLSDGSIHKILCRLERKGYLTSERIRGIPPRIQYQITERSKALLETISVRDEKPIATDHPNDRTEIARSDKIEISRFIEEEIASELFDYETDERKIRSVRKIARRIVDRMNGMIS